MPDYAVFTKFVGKDLVSQALGSMSKSVDKFGNHATSAFNKASRSSSRFGDIVKGVLTANIIQAGARKIKDEFVSVVDAAKEWTSIQTGMKTVFLQDAGKELSFIAGEAKRLGLDLAVATQGYQKIGAAAKGTKLAAYSKDIFLGVSEAGTAMQLSSDQMGGALTALEQIISKGKLSAEELRGQLGERIPGAFQIAARAMGVTTQQLDKLMSTGQITADQFIPKFASQLRKEFGSAAMDASKQFNAAQNRWNNLVFEIKAKTGSTLLPALADIMTKLSPLIDKGLEWVQVNDEFIKLKTVGAVTSISNAFQEAKPYIESTIQTIGDAFNAAKPYRVMAWDVIKDLLSVVKELRPYFPAIAAGLFTYVAATKAWLIIGAAIEFVKFAQALKIAAGAQSLLNLAMTANPVGLVIAGISALVVATVLLYQNWDKVTEALKKAWEWFDKFTGAGKILDAIGNFMSRIKVKIQADAKKDMKGRFEPPQSSVPDKLSGIKSEVQSQPKAVAAAPNKTEIESREVNFKGELNIAGAPKGSSTKSRTVGAPPIRMNLAGVNP